jgi:WD40 repeat protein
MFTADGTTLLSSNTEGLVTMWDVQSGHCLKTVPGIGDIYWLRSVTFSADGRFLVATSDDQTVKAWDVGNGQIQRTFPCHAGRPWVVALSTDQQVLACGTDEGTILLWDRQTGKYLMTLRGERPYERMNINSVTGITEVQKVSLKTLGAIEAEDATKH